VRPEEKNVATRKGRARGGKLSIFPHLTLIIETESEKQSRSETMQVIYERCAALDVHKKTVVTTIMRTQADGSVEEWTRTFSTMTAELLALDDWLRSHDIKVIAMESTGVFWRPVFNLLEEGRQVILVNAQHLRSSSRSEDRCQGQSVACRLAAAWLTHGQFYPAQAGAGAP
jgi:hypothetical protein